MTNQLPRRKVLEVEHAMMLVNYVDVRERALHEEIRNFLVNVSSD